MAKLLRVFFWGMMISFLGSLPLGTLNVAAMEIGIKESIRAALLFSFGSLLMEMIYVRISLIGIDWIRKQEKLMKIMEWVTLGIVAALAIGSFIAAAKTGTHNENPILNNSMNRFLLGVVGCAVNPVVIVFWFGWSTVLFTKKILEPVNGQYNSYIVRYWHRHPGRQLCIYFRGALFIQQDRECTKLHALGYRRDIYADGINSII